MAAKKYNIHDLQSLRQQWQEIAIEAIPEIEIYTKSEKKLWICTLMDMAY